MTTEEAEKSLRSQFPGVEVTTPPGQALVRVLRGTVSVECGFDIAELRDCRDSLDVHLLACNRIYTAVVEALKRKPPKEEPQPQTEGIADAGTNP